ncbi:site-2 protease family protein [Micromonospora sp. NPDC049559]|uniref:site-2 protease family protein n=1 Tax=Micromonospora sp. NPDC049559 TaxID=3155923 RepID=UPI0034484BB2
MRASFRLGTIAGVPVGVNWSVVVIFALIAGALAAGRFPNAYPGNPGWAYALSGIGAALVFFLGLLVHEVSHAVVARRNGLSVRAITLWVFGGVAEIRGRAPGPGAEARITGVGPLVSLLLGGVFAAVAAGIAAAGHRGLGFGVVAWLAAINVALAVFNVIPAAPLDGGRLLRAVLWKWRGDRTWATIAAARAGRFFGAALIVLGVLWTLFLRGVGFGGLWLVLIGWFLLSAARAEQRQAELEAVLGRVRVGEVMSPQPQTVPAGMTVAEFADRYLADRPHTAFPLTEHGRPAGLVTLDRVRRVPLEQRASTAVRAVACPPGELAFASPDEPVTELLPRLSECAENRALVVTDGQLVGIVSPSDIDRAAQGAVGR